MANRRVVVVVVVVVKLLRLSAEQLKLTRSRPVGGSTKRNRRRRVILRSWYCFGEPLKLLFFTHLWPIRIFGDFFIGLYICLGSAQQIFLIFRRLLVPSVEVFTFSLCSRTRNNKTQWSEDAQPRYTGENVWSGNLLPRQLLGFWGLVPLGRDYCR